MLSPIKSSFQFSLFTSFQFDYNSVMFLSNTDLIKGDFIKHSVNPNLEFIKYFGQESITYFNFFLQMLPETLQVITQVLQSFLEVGLMN